MPRRLGRLPAPQRIDRATAREQAQTSARGLNVVANGTGGFATSSKTDAWSPLAMGLRIRPTVNNRGSRAAARTEGSTTPGAHKTAPIRLAHPRQVP